MYLGWDGESYGDVFFLAHFKMKLASLRGSAAFNSKVQFPFFACSCITVVFGLISDTFDATNLHQLKISTNCTFLYKFLSNSNLLKFNKILSKTKLLYVMTHGYVDRYCLIPKIDTTRICMWKDNALYICFRSYQGSGTILQDTCPHQRSLDIKYRPISTLRA